MIVMKVVVLSGLSLSFSFSLQIFIMRPLSEFITLFFFFFVWFDFLSYPLPLFFLSLFKTHFDFQLHSNRARRRGARRGRAHARVNPII